MKVMTDKQLRELEQDVKLSKKMLENAKEMLEFYEDELDFEDHGEEWRRQTIRDLRTAKSDIAFYSERLKWTEKELRKQLTIKGHTR